MNAKNPARRRRPLRWVLGAAAALVVILVVLVALAPTILSTGWGNRQVLAYLSGRLGTGVEARSMAFSWTGSQVIEGLRIADPKGFPPDRDLASVPRAVLSTGIAGLLLSGRRPIAIEVDEPAVNIIRTADGRFNFEAVLRKGEGPAGKPPETGKGGGGAPPKVSRPITVQVKDGAVRYDDASLGASSALSGVGLDLDLRPDDALLRAAATVAQGGGAPGSIEVRATAAGFGSAASLAGLQVDASGEARNLDLRPYRGLLERFLGARPPEGPVGATFTAVTRDGALRGTADLDGGGIAAVRGASWTIPIQGGGPPAAAEFPWTVDLAPAFAAAGSLARLPEGSRAAGSVSGSLKVGGPVSVDDVLRQGTAGLRGVTVDLAARAEGLDVTVPRPAAPPAAGSPPPAGGAVSSPAAAPASPPGNEGGPLRIVEKQLALTIRVVTGSALDDVRIEKATLEGDGLRGDLSGSVRPAGAAGEGGAPRAIDLAGSLDLAIPKALDLLRGSLPAGLEAGPESRLQVTGLSVQGQVGGGRPWTESVGGKGKLSIAGPVKVQGFAVEKADGDVAVAGGRARLEATAAVNGGQVTAKEVAFGLADRTFHLDVATKAMGADYDMAHLLAYVIPFLSPEARRAEFSGKIDSSLVLDGQGFTRADLARALRGQGGVAIADGRISASRFFDQLAGVLGGSLGEVLFTDARSDFEIGDDVIACKKVTLTSPKGTIRNLGLAGTTRIDTGALDYGVDLGVLQGTIGDKKIRRILDAAQQVLKKDTLPMKLAGTVEAPKLAIDPSLGNLDLDRLIQKIPGLDRVPGFSGAPRGGSGGGQDGQAPGQGGPGAKPGGEKKSPAPALPDPRDLLDGLLKKRKK